jgi:predicted small secreted protein
MKKLGITLLLLGTCLLAACNTFEGLGQDVQKGGQNLEKAADKNR